MTDAQALPEEPFEVRLNRYRLFDEVNAGYLRWQLEQFEGHLGKRILEIGCGVGGVIEQLGPREKVLGVDVEPDILEYARKRFAGRPEVSFACFDISAPTPAERALLHEGAFDTALCINVMEHVRDDRSALTQLAEALVPGGSLGILVPAHPGLYGHYDELDGHFRRYTASDLRSKLAGAGFDVVRLHHFNCVGAIGWWVQYRLLHRKAHAQAHLRVMDTLLPPLRRLERAVRPPFGLSLVAVGRRR